jgi:hypothetical protein
MPEIEKPVSVCEVEEPGANLLQTGRRAAAEEFRAQRRRWRRVRFSFVVVLVHCGAQNCSACSTAGLPHAPYRFGLKKMFRQPTIKALSQRRFSLFPEVPELRLEELLKLLGGERRRAPAEASLADESKTRVCAVAGVIGTEEEWEPSRQIRMSAIMPA